MIKLNTNEIAKGYLGDKEITKMILGTNVVYESSKALKFQNKDGETITMSLYRKGSTAPSLQYSTDGKNWTNWNYSAITGSTIYIRGNNPSGLSTDSNNYCSFEFSGNSDVYVSGNIMYLLSYTSKLTAIPNDGCFRNLFRNCTNIVSANILLPATTLTELCYYNLFINCSNLVSGPTILPATTLADYCYHGMFSDCSSLETAPVIAATTYGDHSCAYMFQNCISLTTAPEIQATTLDYCSCLFMFYNCSGLTTAQSILPATTLATQCYRQMFENCTSLTKSPYLPATTLVSDCYCAMFSGCRNLTSVKAYTLTAPGSAYTLDWLYDVASGGTFNVNPDATWLETITRGADTIPSTWQIKTKPDYENEYFTIRSLENGNQITVHIGRYIDMSMISSLEYSYDKTNWTSLTLYTDTTLNADEDECIYFRGIARAYSNSDSYDYWTCFQATKPFEVESNIMSLFWGDDFVGKTDFRPDNMNGAWNLFRQCTNLVNAENLVIPITSTSTRCLSNLFYESASLAKAPHFPPIDCQNTSYDYDCCAMFLGCPLIDYVELPFYNICTYCNALRSMFNRTPIENGTVVCYPGQGQNLREAAGIPDGWTVVEGDY